MGPTEILFYEKQKFTQTWLWVLLIAIFIPFGWGMIQQFFLGQPWGNNPLPDIGLFLVSLIPLGIILLFQWMDLETSISSDIIQLHFSPFVKTTLHWENIEHAEIISYRFVGYGYRIFTTYGTVFNIKGNQGLQIYLKNGRKVLVGTQKPEELGRIAAQCLATR